MIRITVPEIPPSVNHYVKHTRAGRHYRTASADRFLTAMSLALGTKVTVVRGREYEIAIAVYLGKGDRRDWDNCPKVVCDSLVRLGVIDSDAKIKRGSVEVLRDRKNPRTEIRIGLLVTRNSDRDHRQESAA